MPESRHNPVLAGQTAVITGGASGIGKSIVQRFLEAGANCLAADLNRRPCRAQAGSWPSTASAWTSSRSTCRTVTPWRAWSTAPCRRSARWTSS